MQRRIALSVIFFAVIVVSGLIGESRDRVIRIGAAGGGMTPTVVAREILTEAYSRIGYRTEYLEYPPNRMIASFISGQIDALVIAEASFSEDYPNSIRIETPIWVDELVAFTKNPLRITDWESMRAYRIGYISAMLIIEKNLTDGFVTFPVKDSVQLFRMLDIGRIDVVVTSRAVGEFTIANLGVKNISRVKEPLAIVPNYHFLTKRNADIARQLSVVLEEMDRSGRIDEITEATLVRVFSE
jgi:ABC-type amino acid transport substrate-binding protein